MCHTPDSGAELDILVIEVISTVKFPGSQMLEFATVLPASVAVTL